MPVTTATGACCGTHPAGTREPVLKQVDEPHSYYWRELYLPQLTGGPSSAAFLPDGETLVYSMRGSLWRQWIGTATAEELTHATGAYDYQPDVSRDGSGLVFVRYDGTAMELWRLNLTNGHEEQLTTSGAVNVEPRLSPDGRRLAFVSTLGSGRFNLFVADLGKRGLHNVHRLLGERRSRINRYYYSAFDHAINPSWAPDGRTLYYVGNPETALGTGDLWAVNVARPRQRLRILGEETSWGARPELAPDGKRLLYASYRGRQTLQLWLTTTTGAAPLPLTFGDFDRRNARWSPDGSRIVYVDNRDGDSALRVVDTVGGATVDVRADKCVCKLPQARLALEIVDDDGKHVPARVAIVAGDGRSYAPRDAWMCGDDGFDRHVQPLETHYFHVTSPCVLDLPAGRATLWVQHGFARAPWQEAVDLAADRTTTVTARLTHQPLPERYGQFVSADLHIHMNYGGHYRNTPRHLARQARAEDLDVAWNLIVNKEERVPDVACFCLGPDPDSGPDALVVHGQEFHSSFWGHVGILGLSDHLLMPGFAGYQHTAMASPWPTNAVVADLAHAQGALMGYAHPFDVLPDPDRDPVLSHELPADVIHGKVDYIEVMGFSDHKATATVWYRLLNLGFRLPAGAGSDTMANYASLRGPVGMNRVFLDTGGRRDVHALLKALKAGCGFVSNAPQLGLLAGGERPGGQLAPGAHRYRVSMRSPVAVDHLELVHNGAVIESFALGDTRRSFDVEGEVPVQAGWLVLRAWNERSDPGVLDTYPYATTNPVWIGDRTPTPGSRADAEWFARWVSRTREAAAARNDYNTDLERRATLDYLTQARDAYRALAHGRASTTPNGTDR